MEHDTFLNKRSHVNLGFEHGLDGENSDSIDSNYGDLSSHSSSDCGSEPEWNESVGMKGDLFYVENASKTDQRNSSRNDSDIRIALSDYGSQRLCKTKHKDGEAPSFSNKGQENGTIKKPYAGYNENFRRGSQDPQYKVDVKEIVLSLSKTHHNLSRPHLLCETILGIIPGEDIRNGPMPNGNDVPPSLWKSRLVVKGLTPCGPALKSQQIRIGDIILKIDGRDLYYDTMSQELAKLVPPRKIKLQIERAIPNGTSTFQTTEPCDKSFLLRLTKPSLSESVLKNSSVLPATPEDPHVVLFLQNSTNSTASPNDGIVYQYPNTNWFSSLSGMFITMDQLVTQITNSSLRRSTLVIKNQMIRINYYQEDDSLLLIAMPIETVSTVGSEEIMANVARLLRWKYYTLSKAFNDVENRKTIDHFFRLFFHNLLAKNSALNIKSYTFFECLGGIPHCNLGPELNEKIDNLLSELESGDFGDISEAFFDTKRLYLILGCALFYKGTLCTSHLPKDDLMDIYLYSQYLQLLKLTTENEVGQIIVWREVFPTRRRNVTNNIDFNEDNGRWFILMVALNHTLLSLLLEVSGCTARAVNHPPPDPFYVDQARNLLLQLNDTEITCQFEKCLDNQTLPELSNPDVVVNKFKESSSKLRAFTRPSPQLPPSRSGSRQMLHRKELLGKYSLSHSSLLSSPGKKLHDTGSVILTPKKLTSYHGDLEKQSLLARNSPPDDAEHDRSLSPHINESFGLITKNGGAQVSSSCSDAESRTSSEDIYRGLKSQRILSGSFDLSSLRTDLDDIESENYGDSIKLLSGNDVNLFHYVHLNAGEGVLICPNGSALEQNLFSNSSQSPLHSQILKKFQDCVANIHRTFQNTLKSKETLRNKDVSQFSDHSIPPIKEQGVLFRITPLESGLTNNQGKKNCTLAFWVIGRIFTTPEFKEIYVCFQDSTQQNLVELAFKLSFGTIQ